MADAYRRFQRTAKDKEAEKFKRQYEAVLRNKRVITALGVKDAEDLFDKARGAAVYQKPLKVYTTPVTWEQGIGRAWGHILFNPSRGRPIRAKYEVCQPERECRPVVQPLHEERSVCGDIFFTALPVEHADTEGCVAFLVTVDCNGGLVRILITGDLAPHSKWPEWEEAMSSALESPLDLVVIEANTREPAPRTGHLSGTEALEMLKKWKPRAAVLTHISHEGGKGVTHEEMEKELQQKKGDSAVWIGYDGMKVPLTPGGAPREPVDLLETRRPKPTGG
jgi:hypothetical protein